MLPDLQLCLGWGAACPIKRLHYPVRAKAFQIVVYLNPRTKTEHIVDHQSLDVMAALVLFLYVLFTAGDAANYTLPVLGGHCFHTMVYLWSNS